LGVGRGAKTPHRENATSSVKYLQTKPWTWTDNLVQPKQRKKDIRFGTWNVRSLYSCRADSFIASPKELARYKLDLVCVQEVMWDKGGTVIAWGYNFFPGKINENRQLGTEFYVHHRIV
jgi:hypothetical protein